MGMCERGAWGRGGCGLADTIRYTSTGLRYLNFAGSHTTLELFLWGDGLYYEEIKRELNRILI